MRSSFGGLGPSKVLDVLLYLIVVLYPEILPLSVILHEGMAAVAVHIAVCPWHPAIREEDSNLVNGLGSQREEVPEHISVL